MTRLARSMRERLPAFEFPDYRRLWWSAFFSTASNWTMILARGWLIHELTGSAAWVGAATFAGMSPYLFVGPIGGALADRADRRRLVIAANSVSILAAVALMAITLGDLVEPWHIVALAGLGGFGRALGTPPEEALIPNLVPREHLMNAVAMRGISNHGSRLAGPLFGAIVLSAIGAGWVFALSAGFLLLSNAQVARIRYRPSAQDVRERQRRPLSLSAVARELREGLACVEGDPRLFITIGLVTLHCGSTMAFDSMMPTLATNVGGASNTYSGILIGIGAGAIVATLLVSMMREEAAQGRTLAAVGVGSGLSMLVLGFAVNPAMAVAGGVLAGATQASYMAISATLVQRVVPDELRGRVMSIYVMLAAGHMAFVNFGFGWFADSVGVRVLMIVPGLLWTVFFLAAVVWLGEMRHVVRTGSFVPRRPLATAVAAEA